MGFDVTATHLIWIVLVFSVAQAGAVAWFTVGEDVVEARAASHELRQARLLGRLTEASFCHNEANLDVIATATNGGSTTFTLSGVTVLVDGVVAAPDATEISGVTNTDLWRPEEIANFTLGGYAEQPDHLSIVTAEGVQAFLERRECIILTTIVVTPSDASMEVATGPQSFSATGYDQYGGLMEDITFTWSTTAGTLDTLTGDAVTFTPGTTAGAFTLEATAQGVTGIANLTLTPAAPATISVTPDPVDVAAGGAQAFTATVLDVYGNANTTAPVSWSTDAGSISAAGVLTAQTNAESGLFVTATTGSLSDTAAVNVVPGPIDHIDVTPATVTLPTLATQTFSAAAYDAYGNVVTTTFTWSATRGAIDASGGYTAPGTTGADTVTASADGVDGTAAVSVVDEVHVESITTYLDGVETSSFRKREVVETRVLVRDHEGSLIQGATVQIQLIDANGAVAFTGTGVTDANGVASISHTLAANAAQGQWIDRVTNITGTDLVYDSAANVVTQVTFAVG